MQCLVLGARRYDFKDDDGAPVRGVTLYYLTGDADEAEENQVGEIPMQVSAPLAVFDQLDHQLPAYYDVDFRQRPGRGGRPTLQATGVSYSGSYPVAGPPTSPGG